MIFHPQMVQANLTLGRIHPENTPQFAVDALEAGYDGPVIRRMAGLTNPSGWGVDQLIPRFMAELNLQLISKEEATVRLAYELARRIIDESLNPRDFTSEFFQLWVASDYIREIQSLGTLEDDLYLVKEVYGQTDEQAGAYLYDTLVTFLRERGGILIEGDLR